MLNLKFALRTLFTSPFVTIVAIVSSQVPSSKSRVASRESHLRREQARFLRVIPRKSSSDGDMIDIGSFIWVRGSDEYEE
jgi:hypothetical protein